ncbi:Bifunctional dihydropteroate synthase/dihydropteroate reductase [Campylobacter majalis]|uniref:dihydropteroate synthase n=1 Tax=Campylobacter majalis TaxID=2790656 RepID=A0ABM8Q1R8_9BACT|nr:dihydropteroate synthase [Campylobacter majalis]CAD7286782.1 Bifunctional dihydropteroate synthase/dihydropteroate reductase [Campylobacter majalis]
MKFYNINEKSDFDVICKSVGVSVAGINLMREKSSLSFVYIKDIKSPAANILKQDAISVGAELVTHKDTIFGLDTSSNALLIGTDAQLKKLSKKEKLQDFGLKNLAKFLEISFNKPENPKIMGVLNINNDSFNASSRIDIDNALLCINKMIDDGADYIDIGGVSSRPGSVYVGRDEEFRRIKDVILQINAHGLDKKVKFSLDSFDEYCLEFALNHGFKMINDISANENLALLAKKYDCELCMMHMQNDPATMQINPHYDDLLAEISDFFEHKVLKARDLGAKHIVIDVGIGFGKTAEQNLLLIKHLKHFLKFQCDLLVGASRKSLINHYFKSEVHERLSGSLYLHLKAFENGASIIRTHDVSEHKQMFALHSAYQKANLW